MLRSMGMAGTWLCRDDMDRERLLDMEERLKPVRQVAFAFLGITLILSAPWIGLWTLLPLALAASRTRSDRNTSCSPPGRFPR